VTLHSNPNNKLGTPAVSFLDSYATSETKVLQGDRTGLEDGTRIVMGRAAAPGFETQGIVPQGRQGAILKFRRYMPFPVNAAAEAAHVQAIQDNGGMHPLTMHDPLGQRTFEAFGPVLVALRMVRDHSPSCAQVEYTECGKLMLHSYKNGHGHGVMVDWPAVLNENEACRLIFDEAKDAVRAAQLMLPVTFVMPQG
jgi:hypothetical protein